MKQAIKSIKDSTPLLPYVIADMVVSEVERFLKLDVPGRESRITQLVETAEQCYQANERWRHKIRGRCGREYLYSFMRHWLSAELKWMWPPFKAVPTRFWNGEPI